MGTDNLFVKTFLSAWTGQVARINELLESTSDEDLHKEVAPGKNTGVYLIGHLAAVHDALFPLLGFGKKLYPHLEKPFITTPDKSGLEFPPAHELKKCWNDVNTQLLQQYNLLKPEEWLSRHTAVSVEDFAKQSHRNKLNVLISRTTHMSYHHGQLVFLKKK
jgi:hypothetical protein